MDDSLLSSVIRPRSRVLRRAVWPAVTSVLLATCLAATSAESDPLKIGENHDHTDWSFRFAGETSSEPDALSALAVDADPHPPPSIDLTSFNERFGDRPIPTQFPQFFHLLQKQRLKPTTVTQSYREKRPAA